MIIHDWQEQNVQFHLAALSKHNVSIEASACGSGKTYIACEVIRRMDKPALIIAPKAALVSWRRVAEASGVGRLILDVINTERLAYSNQSWFSEDKAGARWHLPQGCMILIDEAHKGCAGPKSATTKRLALLKAYKLPILMLSATIANSPLQMRVLGYFAGLHSFNNTSFYDFCRRHGCTANPWGGLEFPSGPKGQRVMEAIRKRLADKMIRLSLDEIPGFPECDTQVKLYNLEDRYETELQKIYDEMAAEVKQGHTNPLVDLLRHRQRAEICKTPLLTDLCMEAVEAGQAPVVFVCFKDTLDIVREKLNAQGISASTVLGGQSTAVRVENIDRFQRQQTQVCLCMIQAGGVSVSLHAVEPEALPRIAFICPSFSAVEVTQALGRIHRAGSRHKAVQRFVLAANTVEERVYKAITKKLGCIDTLNGDDLTLWDLEKEG